MYDIKAEQKKGNRFWKELESKNQSSGQKKNSQNETRKDKGKKSTNFWRDEKESSGKKRVNFEEYLQVQEEIKKGIAEGRLFEGNIRVNPNNRNRAFISIEGIKLDVMIDGVGSQNRALDGDTVVIQLLDPSRWPSLITSNIIIGGKKLENKGFTNETAIETRVIDAERGLSHTEAEQSSSGHIVQENKVPTPNKLPPKRASMPNILGESDCEGED